MTYIQCCNIIHHVLCLRNWVFRRWWWHHISLTCAWLNWLVSLMKIYFPRQRPYKAPTSWNPACHLNGGWWRGQILWSPKLMAFGQFPRSNVTTIGPGIKKRCHFHVDISSGSIIWNNLNDKPQELKPRGLIHWDQVAIHPCIAKIKHSVMSKLEAQGQTHLRIR